MTSKYSIIFMRDGGKTHRLRLGSTLLHVLLIILVVVPLVAAASLALNWKLYRDSLALRAENTALQRKVESNAQTAARLANLEQFLRKTDPEGLGELVPAVAPPAESMAVASAEPVTAARTDAGSAPGLSPQAGPDQQVGETPPGEPPAALNQDSAGEPTAPPATSATSATSAPAAPAEPAGPAADAGQASDSADPEPLPVADDTPDVVDKGFVRVENLSARRVGARSLRVSFDLYNTERVPQVSGKATFELLLDNGETYALSDHGDTTYRINRLKKIVGNPPLPPDVSEVEGASVRVSIYADGDLVYQVVTPLQS